MSLPHCHSGPARAGEDFPFRVLFPHAIALLLLALLTSFFALPCSAAAPWWNPDWKHRYTVTAPNEIRMPVAMMAPGWREGTPAPATAEGTISDEMPEPRRSLIVEIDAPEAKADGGDFRVINEAQQEIPFRVVHHTTDKKFTLEIFVEVPAAVPRRQPPPSFFVYYGNPNANFPEETPPPDETRLGPIVVDIRYVGQGQEVGNWDEMQMLLERMRREAGRQFVKQVNPEAVTFERVRPQLNIYRAHFLVAEEGDYAFSLDSAGSSFLLIDEKLALANAEDARWGRFKTSSPIHLTAAVHRLELYHLCAMSNSPVSLGWLTPSDPRPTEQEQNFNTMPAEVFLTAFRGQLKARETLGEALNPFFTYQFRNSLRINDATGEFATVQFTDTTVAAEKIAARAWDFGDGGTSTALQPTHVFADNRERTVTLTVTDKKGRTQQIQRRLEWQRSHSVALKLALELARLPLVVTSETLLDFSAVVANPQKRGDLELSFHWRPLPQNKGAATAAAETDFAIGPEDYRSFEVEPGAAGSLTGVELELLCRDIVVAKKKVRLLKHTTSLSGLSVAGSRLQNADGDNVVLVVERAASNQSLSSKFTGRVVCLDDALLGNGVVVDGGSSYAQALETNLRAAWPGQPVGSTATVRHVPWLGRERGNIAAALFRLTHLDDVPLREGDLVVLSIGLPDLFDRLSPDAFENQLRFIVDYLRHVRRAHVLLVTPPPVPSEPEAARPYARKVVQVGLETGAPVCDLHGLMLMRPDWRDFFRDTAEGDGAFFLYANRRGQKWMAEELGRAILDWRRASPSRG